MKAIIKLCNTNLLDEPITNLPLKFELGYLFVKKIYSLNLVKHEYSRYLAWCNAITIKTGLANLL